jgi:AraC-like DNA-binding protein
MYDPVNDGMKKGSVAVSYREAKPPRELEHIVHTYWQLTTEAPLDEDFILHALPDACVNILFNQLDTNIAGITALHTTYTELNLGREFDYAGIQLFPGVWRGRGSETKDDFVGTKYLGELPLIEANVKTAPKEFADKHYVFTNLISQLIDQGIIEPNAVTERILSNLDSIHSVADMAEATHRSPRQLQRVLKQTTGFSPHDFLKVVRLQESLKRHNLDRYTDQSHFIHSFKKITGYTPTEYFRKYDV